MAHVDRRQKLLDTVAPGELYTRQIANRLGKTESTVKAMLVTMAADGVVTSRFAAIDTCPRPVLMWQATGKPLPNRPTAIERRSVTEREHVPQFNFDALVMAMRGKR
jgi:predicted ArsR family transcriptional regulator